MMMVLLELKGKLKELFQRYYVIAKPVVKFLVAFFIFIDINIQMGYDERISKIGISFVLAIICSFIPSQMTVYFALLISVIQVSFISPVLGISLLIFILSVILLVVKHSREQCFAILAIPLLTVFHISYLVPLLAGIFCGPSIISAIVIGVIFRYIFMGIQEVSMVPAGTIDLEDMVGVLKYVVDYVLENNEIMLFLISFVITYLVTYLTRRRKVKYASQVGILVGTMNMLIFFLMGNIIIDAEINVVMVLFGISISTGIAYIIQFFHITLDYTGIKSLQFEDEEYYYYVKAVPKLSVAKKEETRKLINPKQELDYIDEDKELKF